MTSPPAPVFLEAMLLGVALLNGGNRNVQVSSMQSIDPTFIKKLKIKTQTSNARDGIIWNGVSRVVRAALFSLCCHVCVVDSFTFHLLHTYGPYLYTELSVGQTQRTQLREVLPGDLQPLRDLSAGDQEHGSCDTAGGRHSVRSHRRWRRGVH